MYPKFKKLSLFTHPYLNLCAFLCFVEHKRLICQYLSRLDQFLLIQTHENLVQPASPLPNISHTPPKCQEDHMTAAGTLQGVLKGSIEVV